METESKTKRGGVVAAQGASTGVGLGFLMQFIRAHWPTLIPWGPEQDVVFLGAVIGPVTGAWHALAKLLPHGWWSYGKDETKKGKLP